MLRVVTRITNLEDCQGSHSIPAIMRAEILEENQLDIFISEMVVVNNQALAEKVVACFHYERDFKKSPISLSSALELVMEKERLLEIEEVKNEIDVIHQQLASDIYDKLYLNVYAAYTEAVEAEKHLTNSIDQLAINDEQKDVRLLVAADLKNHSLELSRDVLSFIKLLKKGEEKRSKESEL